MKYAPVILECLRLMHTSWIKMEIIEVFKTNVSHKGDARKLINLLSRLFPDFRFTFDLDDQDRILRAAGPLSVIGEIRQVLTKAGYDCQLLD